MSISRSRIQHMAIENGIFDLPTGRQAKKFANFLILLSRFIFFEALEAGSLLIKIKRHIPHWSISMFCYNYFNNIFIFRFRFFSILSIQKHRYIGVLLDRSRFSQIRKSRNLRTSIFHRSRKLG